MLAAREPGKAAWLLSLLLHGGLLAVLWWSAAPAVLQTPPPLAVELWAGGGSVSEAAASAKPVVPPAPVSKSQPPAVPAVAQAQVPQLSAADITLKGGKPQAKPQPPATEPAKTVKKVPAEKTEAPKPQPAPAKPAKATRAAPVQTDDLLAGLDDLPPGPGKGKVTQPGGKQGSREGAVNGQINLKQQYAEAVRNRVRPYIDMPDGIKGNPEVEVEVILLPTLEILSSRVLRGSAAVSWDQAVLAALRDTKRFPPLPKGAEFTDYRRITVTFRPKE